MKSTLLISICIASTLLTSCEESEQTTPERASGKKIIQKESPVEQRMGFDFFADEPLRQKTVTIYYLVAEDGTVAEVGLSDFVRTKIGDTYVADSWQNK